LSRRYRIPAISGGRQTNSGRKGGSPTASYDGLEYNTSCSFQGLMERRGGWQDVISSGSKPAAWSSDATFHGAAVYRPASGTPYLLVCYKRHGAATSGISKITITSPTSMSFSVDLSGSSGINPSAFPIYFRQINEWIYFSVPGDDSVSGTYRYNGTTLQYAGLPMDAPSGVTVTYAAAGGRMETTLVGGTLHEYEYATTVLYGGLGESAITPLTNALGSTAAASTGQITLALLAGKSDLGPTAGSVQYTDATALRIYRTLNNPGQPNVTRRWFLVTEIPVASLTAGHNTTTYVDVYNDTELGDEYQGDPLFVSNPDSGAKLMAASFLEWIHNRMWYANIYDRAASTHTPYQNRVYWSEAYMPDRILGFVDVDPRPQDQITGLAVWRENLVVFKNSTVFLITGDTPPNGTNLGNLQIIETGRGFGCVSGKSIATGKDGIYYRGNDGVYLTDGYNFKRITDDIRPDMIGVSRTKRTDCCGGYYQGRYFLAHPKDFTNQWNVFVYDESYAQPGTWHGWQVAGCYPNIFIACDEQVDNARFYAGGYGNATGSRLHIIDNSFYDVATNGGSDVQIFASWTSRWLDMGEPDEDKQFRAVVIDYDELGTAITLAWSVDDGSNTGTTTYSLPAERYTGTGATGSPYTSAYRRPIAISLPDAARGRSIKLTITDASAKHGAAFKIDSVAIDWDGIGNLVPDGDY